MYWIDRSMAPLPLAMTVIWPRLRMARKLASTMLATSMSREKRPVVRRIASISRIEPSTDQIQMFLPSHFLTPIVSPRAFR